MPRPPKKPREVWDDQKQRIQTLYMIEAKTLSQLMNIMRDEHGFIASKREYVKRLEMWDMSKYAKTKHRKVAREADLEYRIRASTTNSRNGIRALGQQTEQHTSRGKSYLQSAFITTSNSARNKPSMQFAKTAIHLIMQNIPWFQFEHFFSDWVPEITQELIMSFDWGAPQNYLLGSLSGAELFKQHTRNLLQHMMDDSSLGADMVQQLEAILPRKSSPSLNCGPKERFLMLIQCCIYLSSNNLLELREMDRFLDYLLKNGFLPLFNTTIDRLSNGNFPTMKTFLAHLLLSAVSLKRSDIVLALLKKGVSPNGSAEVTDFSNGPYPGQTITNHRRNTSPLQVSILRGDLQTCLILLQHGALANGMTKDTPFRPLELAITGQIESYGLAEALIRYGANLNYPCHIGLISESWIDTLELCLKIYYRQGNCYTKASELQNMPLLELMLIHRHNPGDNSLPLEPALCSAVRNNDLEMVDILLQHGANVDVGCDEMERAFQQYIHEELKIYHSKLSYMNRAYEPYNWEPTQTPWQVMAPIRLAARQNDLDMARKLLSAGAYINAGLSVDTVSNNIREVSKLFHDDNNYDDHTCLEDLEPQFIKHTELLNTALHEASRNGNLELTEMLLQAGAVVECGDSAGTTPLQLACGLSELPVDKARELPRLTLPEIRMSLVKTLLVWGANIQAAAGKWDGRTALQAAAEQGDVELVRFLINKGADVNAAPSPMNGKTAFGAAIEARVPCIVDLLVENGAMPTAKDHFSTLHVAAIQGDVKCIEQLLPRMVNLGLSENPEWIQKTGTELNMAIKSGQGDVVEMMLKGGVDPNQVLDGETAICTAVRQNNTDIFNLLLSHGANANAPGCEITPLVIAMGSRSVSMIESILQLNIDINKKSKWHQYHKTPRSYICDSGYLTTLQWTVFELFCGDNNDYQNSQFIVMIKMLLSNGADINGSEDLIPLVEACRQRDVSLTRLLIDNDADINAMTRFGESPIGTAAEYGSIEIVQILIDAGADVSGPVLHHAAELCREATLRMLLDAGAAVNAVNRWGETALAKAMDDNKMHTVQLLLDKHADANLDPTCLRNAVENGSFNVVKLLIERGLVINLGSRDGRIALEIAAKYGRLDIICLLLENDTQLDRVEETCEIAASEAAANGHTIVAEHLRRYKTLQRQESFQRAGAVTIP